MSPAEVLQSAHEPRWRECLFIALLSLLDTKAEFMGDWTDLLGLLY